MLFRLTEEQRIVFIFRIMLGFSYKEISAVINETIEVIKSRLSRARVNLTKHIKGRCQWYNDKSSCTCEKCIGFAIEITPELLNVIDEAVNKPKYLREAAGKLDKITDIEELYRNLPQLEYKTYPLKKI